MNTKYLKSISFLAVAAILAGCKEETAQAPEQRSVRTIITQRKPLTVERQSVGEIKPMHESELAFRVSGKLVARKLDVGMPVRRGDILATLDAQDFENKKRTAEADVQAAEAVLREAKANEERQRTLLSKGVATRAAHDAARRGLESARASVKSANAALALASDQLAYTSLRAEFDGIVTMTGVEAGQVVNAGQMILKIAPQGARYAEFAIAESVLQEKFFQQDSVVSVALLSAPTISTTGKVSEIAPIADPATRTFTLKVELRDPPEAMMFGAAVTGRVIVSRANGFHLPPSAIFDQSGNPAVWLVSKDSNSVSLRPVTVAQYETERVIINDGIAEGDIVVTAGVNRLREGQKVTLAGGPH